MFRTEPYLTRELLIDEYIDSQFGASEFLVPSNHPELIVSLAPTKIKFKRLGSARAYDLKPEKTYFFMPRSRGAEIIASESSEYLLIRLNPICTGSLIKILEPVGMGIYEIKINSELLLVMKRLISQRRTFELNDLIYDFIGEGIAWNETVYSSIDLIKSSNGTISVKEIYERLGVSKSKLEQHFNREVGLTPKEFCKIEKLNYFLSCHQENPQLSLTELTYLGGYYDQSHLIKDFNYFLGMSPKRFLERA